MFNDFPKKRQYHNITHVLSMTVPEKAMCFSMDSVDVPSKNTTSVTVTRFFLEANEAISRSSLWPGSCGDQNFHRCNCATYPLVI